MSRTLAFAVVVFIAVVCKPARSQPVGPEIDAEAAYNSPLLFLVPQAKDTSAPDWVKPGTRITFYGMAGSTPQGGYSLDKDANGQWVDPATGERYTKNDAVGAGGEGFGQFDVIAVGQHGVALSANLYTIIQPGNPPSLLHTPLGGMLAAAAGPADLWVHPEILNKAQQFHSPNFFILRGKYPIGNAVYDCLCIVHRDQNSYSSHAYDLRTGVLISGTTTSEGKMAQLRLPNEEAQRGNKGTTITKFVNIRQLKTPGVNGTNPPWVRNVRAMHFVGEAQYVNQYDSNIRMNFPARMDVQFGKRGDNWCQFNVATQMQIQGAPPQQGQMAGVCGPAGGWWIDPAALRDLRVGMVLDEDPVTRIRTYVSGADAQAVQISVEGPGVGGRAMYARDTGALQSALSHQPSTGITTMLCLQAME